MDPLDRYIEAQHEDYTTALSEIRGGRKHSHWMWYIFPQLDGLGVSSTSKYYAIRDLQEAKAYLNHPVLGPRLIRCVQEVLDLQAQSAQEIFGSPDDLKLRSSATLFAQISPAGSVFHQLIDQYFEGRFDSGTLELLTA